MCKILVQKIKYACIILVFVAKVHFFRCFLISLRSNDNFVLFVVFVFYVIYGNYINYAELANG